MVTVEKVVDLYAKQARMEAYKPWKPGQVNPFNGLCAVIPETATYYAQVHEKDRAKRELALLTLKGLAKRRKVRQRVCEKDEICFNQFAPAGKIVVFYV